jgi:hypothetical protein
MLLSKREESFLCFGVIFRHSGTVDANQAFFEGGNFIPPSINVEAFPVYSVAADANQAYDGRSFCFSINLLLAVFLLMRCRKILIILSKRDAGV